MGLSARPPEMLWSCCSFPFFPQSFQLFLNFDLHPYVYCTAPRQRNCAKQEERTINCLWDESLGILKVSHYSFCQDTIRWLMTPLATSHIQIAGTWTCPQFFSVRKTFELMDLLLKPNFWIRFLLLYLKQHIHTNPARWLDSACLNMCYLTGIASFPLLFQCNPGRQVHVSSYRPSTSIIAPVPQVWVRPQETSVWWKKCS